MISRRALLGSAALAACGRRPGSGYHGYALVATDDPPSISVVDLLGFALKIRTALPGVATSLLPHPDPGVRLIYALVPKTQSIQELAVAGAVTRSVRLGAEPIAAQARAGTLWCLVGGAAPQLLPLDLGSLRPGRALALPALPVALDISPVAPLAALTLADGSLMFADLEARKLLGALPIGPDLGSLCFRADGKLVIVAGRARRQLAVVEARTRRLMSELPLALSPDHFCLKSDGGQLFLTGEGRDAVVIAYPYRTEIAQTSLSPAASPAPWPARNRPIFCLSPTPAADSVTIFDISSQRVVARRRRGPRTVRDRRYPGPAVCPRAEPRLRRHGGDPHRGHRARPRQAGAPVHDDPGRHPPQLRPGVPGLSRRRRRVSRLGFEPLPVAAEHAQHVGQLFQVPERAAHPLVVDGAQQIDIEKILPGPATQRTRFDLGQADVA